MRSRVGSVGVDLVAVLLGGEVGGEAFGVAQLAAVVGEEP